MAMAGITYPAVVIPRELGEWINQHLPVEATWEVHPVLARTSPNSVIGYDVIVTGDQPPSAARAQSLEEACRAAVQRYGKARNSSMRGVQ
jgi:hypothetical protein